MRLFIAEKPSLGKAIAQYLPAKGTPKGPAGKPPTHIIAGDDVVTWCFGHLLEMAQPEDYSEALKKWDFELLPMVPDEWRLIPKDDAKGQIKAIKDLLAEADEVVNAGDPDREGQLLVDELLEHLGNKRPVKRIWLGLAAAHPCPVCKQGHLRRRTSDKGPFWGCSRYQEGCKTSFPDKAGRPDLAPKKPAGKKPGGGLGRVSLAMPGAKKKG